MERQSVPNRVENANAFSLGGSIALPARVPPGPRR